jgi:hypothetical protein
VARHRGLVLALIVAALAVAFQQQRFARAGERYDRFDLPGFDAHVYVAMATHPTVFSVPPWGYRILTPLLVEALPLRTMRAFRDVTAAGLMAAALLLFLWLRRLGNGELASLAAVLAFGLSGPVAEAVQYRFLVEPVTLALELLLLLALSAEAPLPVLALVAVVGVLSKEFFLLLLPLVLIERGRSRGLWRGLGDTATVAAPAVAATLWLRLGWTPYLHSALPQPGPVAATALQRFSESWPDWRVAVLLGGLLPLAIFGACLPKARGHRAAGTYLLLATLLSPFLNPLAFFARDIPRLLLYALPAVFPLALLAVDRVVPHLAARPMAPAFPRPLGWIAGTAAVGVLALLVFGLDPYRRVDLSGPRDGPLALAVCRESLRTAARLERGESVSFDMADQEFVWGETPFYEFARMRWFLREGFGVRPQYGTGDALSDGSEATLLLPVLTPRDLDLSLDLALPAGSEPSVFVNRMPVGELSGAVGELRVPAALLVRGDNRLSLALPAGARLRRFGLRPAG